MTLSFIYSFIHPLTTQPRLQNKTKQNTKQPLLDKVSPDNVAMFCLPSLSFTEWKVLF